MGVSRFHARRGAAFALALGIGLAAVGGGSPARAASPTTTDPAEAAAGWIAAQVGAGDLGAGSLADAIFAFAATHVGGTAAAAALTQLEGKVGAYAGYGGTLNPGNLAKATLAVVVAGGNPASFGGHDLEGDLRGLQATSGTDAGRFGSGGNYDQAMAILALAATSGGVPSGAGAWLAGRQCASGEYTWDGSCPTGSGSEDPDTSAVALQALLAAGESTAADKATEFLAGLQAGNGSLASYGTPNTNSTGIGGQALRAAGRASAADAAAAWVAAQQYGCSAPAADRGAFPWAASYAGELIYSTTQAVLAFGAPRLDRLTLEGAAAEAPVLACAVPPAGPSGGVLPTQPATDAAPAARGAGPVGWPLLALTLLAAVGGALAAGRHPARRR